MELAIIIVLVLALISISAVCLVKAAEDRRIKRKQPTCIVYLMRIDETGKIEVKRSPKQDMWNWKF
jgi:hypothetical protein